MDKTIGEHIVELVGEEATQVIIIADNVLDINTSAIEVIEYNDINEFTKYTSVKKATQEAGRYTQQPRKAIHIRIAESLVEPLHIVCEHSENPGTYVYVEILDNVKATIVEHQVLCSCGLELGEIEVPVLVELEVGRNCNILYSAFDTSGLVLAITRYVSLRKDTELNVAIGMFGKTCKSENYIGLLEEGATVESKLMMYVENQDKQLHLVKMNHLAPHTKSNIINHGVVTDNAIGEFEGIGFIQKGAHQADAQQESRIMVLDDKARADVHPILLIDEYDVMAGHAGSVGRVSDDALYYLQSRGLTRKDALLLVTEGFLRPVVENIEDLPTKQRIENVITKKVGLFRGV
ncbi:MAG: SufD family Fe-S cluster assembly protein [Culicoidibacterales bacterium]